MGFYDMMTGWGGGSAGWTMSVGMAAFWVGVIALIIFGIRALVGAPGSQAPRGPQESALEVLKRRYAAGEIDATEFQQKKPEVS